MNLTKAAERTIMSDSATHQTDGSKETIKQLIPAEPGWYMEEELSDGYKYHRVLFWIMLEDARFGDITRLTGIITSNINDELIFPLHLKAVFLPQLDAGIVHSKVRLGNG
jgi:hypothetical protein